MTPRIMLITGATSGIGRATAARFASAGWTVYAAQRSNPEPPIANVHYLQLNITDSAAVDRTVATILERSGRIDALINNAGYALMGAIEESTPEQVRALMETNFMGTFHLCRAISPVMRAQKFGHIINVSSLAGLLGLPFSGIYSATKFAVEGLSESLRHELRPFGVQVCLVEPGDIATDLPANRRYTGASDGPYSPALARMKAAQDKDEAAAPPPDLVAQRIETILATHHPVLRHVVGKLGQTIVVPLKRWLPQRLFERILRLALGI